MVILNCTLPYPPSVNHYWHHDRRGNTYISKNGKQFLSDVLKLIRVKNTCLGRLAVEVTVNVPDKRKRDIDNISKALLDSLQKAGVYGDDSQIDDLHIKRGEVVKFGSVHVVIKKLECE